MSSLPLDHSSFSLQTLNVSLRQRLLDWASVSEPRNVRSFQDLLDWANVSEPRNVRSGQDLLDWASVSEPRNVRSGQDLLDWASVRDSLGVEEASIAVTQHHPAILDRAAMIIFQLVDPGINSHLN